MQVKDVQKLHIWAHENCKARLHQPKVKTIKLGKVSPNTNTPTHTHTHTDTYVYKHKVESVQIRKAFAGIFVR